MTETYLHRVYETGSEPEAQQSLYDEWATSYDEELLANGYATPTRIAASLAAAWPERDAAILDFGCGTGLSGSELANAGFTTIDGCDLSPGMLSVARTKGVYRHLNPMTAGVLDIDPADYGAIIACGVISPGAAPASTLALIAAKVRPGGVLAFSYNQYAMVDDEYMGVLNALLTDDFTELSRASGVHIEKLGSESTVLVLKRAG